MHILLLFHYEMLPICYCFPLRNVSYANAISVSKVSWFTCFMVNLESNAIIIFNLPASVTRDINIQINIR